MAADFPDATVAIGPRPPRPRQPNQPDGAEIEW